MSRRLRPVLVAVALLAAACGGDTTPTTTGIQIPTQAVADWLDAVEALDMPTLSSVVVDGSLAVVMGIENDLPPEQIAALLDGGVPADVEEAYWRSFREEFAAFAGRPISTLAVGDAEEFEAEGVSYAAVEVVGTGGASSVVIVRRDPASGWAVDPVATLAPGFIGPLRREFENLPGGEAGESVTAAYRAFVSPSLWAALGSGAFDDRFAREALSLIEEIDASGA